MNKLKTLLQWDKFYLALLIISVIYLIITTIVIKYDTKYHNETNFEGYIENYKIDGDKVTIYFKSKEKLIGTYYLRNIEEKEIISQTIKYGSKVIINGELQIPSNNTILNTFNYKKYLYNKKIYRTISIKDLKINNDNITILNRIKNKLTEIINKRDNKEYLKTFILGDKNEIDIEDYQNYQLLGVTHLFAISGMHITLFSTSILFIFKKLKTKENKAIIISLIFLFIYSLITNFPSSIRRAYILYLFLSTNKILNLKIKTINLYYLTITLNIFIEPFIIYDLGFQYSSIITYGLLLSKDKLNSKNYIKNLFKTSLISFILNLPLAINTSYQINLLTPINNLFIVPLISFIIYPLSVLSLLSNIFNPILNISITILKTFEKFLLKINVLNIIIPKIPLLIIIVYYLILYIALTKNRKYYLIIIIIIIIKILPYLDNSRYIFFLDVSQGDSALLITENKKDVILIDSGGKITYPKQEWQETNTSYSLSDNTIKFLKSFGISKIDKLIISHGDFDHMGEAINLVNNFKVEKVIFNCGPYNNLEKNLIKVLDEKKIEYSSCINELNIDNNKLYFLQTKVYDNENDNSNVIYTELNGYKFMFMGDASSTTEKEILKQYDLPYIDVLKVGHHGSKTSSSKEFINKINPEYSVISVGKNNRYGHPNKEPLENLSKSEIYRTDRDGSIMFKIKNNKLKIETCPP